MSKIAFLDNALQGKNDWWRYILTIIFTWILPLFIFGVLFAVYSSVTGVNLEFLRDSLSSVTNAIGDSLGYVLVFIFFYLCIHFIHKQNFISVVNIGFKVHWRKILSGFGLWFLLEAIGVLILFVADPALFEVTFNLGSFALILVLSLIMFPVQASMEELFFRGYLMQGISLLSKKPVVPLIVTSILFTCVHFGYYSSNALQTLYVLFCIFIGGLTWGITVLGENGVETAIGAHIARNTFTALTFTGGWGIGDMPALLTISSSAGEASINLDIMLLMIFRVLMAIIFLMIIFWNKKEKIEQIIT